MKLAKRFQRPSELMMQIIFNNYRVCLYFPEFSVLLYFKVSKISGFISWDFIFQDMGFSHGIGMPSPALRAQGEELTITFIN